MTLDWNRATEMAQLIAGNWQEGGQPGGAITLFDCHQVRAVCCGGMADLAQGTPFSVKSVVRFASLTKHLLATLVTGPLSSIINLSDTLAQHLPQLTGPSGQVTVGQALDMTSGLHDVRETLSLLGVSIYNATQADKLLDFVTALDKLNYPAGSEISYSNTGYRLVEEGLKAKGVVFADVLHQQICEPLALHFMAPETWFDIAPGLVPGYWRGRTGWQLASAGQHLSASGSVVGSVQDLTVWLQSLLRNEGPGRGVLARLSSARRLVDGRVTDYGLGIAHTRIGDAHWVGHGGAHAGYRCYFLLDEHHGVGMALVANREDVAPYDCALRIMAALRGQYLPQPGHALIQGLYVAEHGGEWLEIAGNNAHWLGASAVLYPHGIDKSQSVSFSSHLPMRLRQRGINIEGEIGHAKRRFVPPRTDDSLNSAQGRWFCLPWRSEWVIAGDQLIMGIGPSARSATLVCLGKGRFLATMHDGSWEKRFAVYIEGNNMRLLLNRSRVLTCRRGKVRWD